MTFIHPGAGDHDAVEVGIDDQTAPAWRYPGCYSYTRAAIAETVGTVGLWGRPIGWFHPRHQWWLLSQTANEFPPEAFLAALTGPTLAEGSAASWDETNSTALD